MMTQEMIDSLKEGKSDIKDGTVRDASDIDWTSDYFNRTANSDPGFYVYFGMWKGPFDNQSDATEAYREWDWERRNS